MDFVTGLPPSSGMTVVLTVVDRFSRAAHFIPLPKLPSAGETVTVVLDHVFRIHGLSMNVVSERGPPVFVLFLDRILSTAGGDCGFILRLLPTD